MPRSMRRAGYVGLTLALAVIGAVPVADATYPGGNGRIASGANVEDDFEITLVAPVTRTSTSITDNDAFDACPAWSPDGTQIAYCSDLGHPDTYDIFVMDEDGSDVRNVTDGRVWGTFPDWSPDSSRLVFEGQVPGEDAIDVWVVNVDGSDLHRLAGVEQANLGPVWSPNGRRIAFSSATDPEPFELYTVNARGRDLRLLSRDVTAGAASPDWRPDGRRIAFDSDEYGSRDLFSIRRDGEGLRRLTRTPVADELLASWSPDGRKIAYNVIRAGQRDIARRVVDGARLGPERLITDDAVFQLAPSWQPRP